MPDSSSRKTTAAAISDESLVDFENPPVNEVACGVGFSSLRNLTAAHIGLFWSDHRKRFPVAGSAMPITGYAEGGEFPLLGRTLLRSADETELLQIQPTRFYYNWIKSGESTRYPRFPEIFRTFVTHFNEFERFVTEHELGLISIREFTLSYVNVFYKGTEWQTLSDIKKIFPDLNWRASAKREYVSQLSDFDCRFVFPLNERPGRLSAILKHVSPSDQKPFLRFELVVQTTVQEGLSTHDLSYMKEWFFAAREAIVLGFVDLTSRDAQTRFWGRKD